DVQAAEFLDDLGDDLVPVGLAGNVEALVHGSRAARGDFPGGLRARVILHVGEYDGGAFRGERARGGEADAAGGASDQGDLVFKTVLAGHDGSFWIEEFRNP